MAAFVCFTLHVSTPVLLSLVGGRASLCQPPAPPRQALAAARRACVENRRRTARRAATETVAGPPWKDGYSLPVVIMKTTGKFPNYQKEAFVQSFNFESGNCIKDDGTKTLYYFLKADGVC